MNVILLQISSINCIVTSVFKINETFLPGVPLRQRLGNRVINDLIP